VLRTCATLNLHYPWKPLENSLLRIASVPGIRHHPIRVNPWMLRCKKMAECQSTQFQPNVMFSCTGKVVGLLDHRLMVQAFPASAGPYLYRRARLLVILGKTVAGTFSQLDPKRHQLSPKSSPSDSRSKFMSPVKRKANQAF
jgi:hypothetical protein